MFLLKDDIVSSAIMSQGWENNLVQMLDYLLATDPNVHNHAVVDCGGNVGHFTMFAAARHLRVTTFEMQPNLFVLLEMSVRASGYSSHVKIHNAPLWETDGEVMGFTPVSGNFGGTHLLADGATKVTTRRFDSLFTEQDIYFLKLDMEGAEKHSVGPGKPMDKWFRERRVRHLFQETRREDLPIFEYYYDHGIHCKDGRTTNYGDNVFFSREEALANVAGLVGDGFADYYCTLANKS